MANNHKIIVGKINGFHGVRGYLKVFSETRPRESILSYPQIYLKKDGQWRLFDIDDGVVHGKNILIKLSGYNNRNDVEIFFGMEIAVDQSMLPVLGDGKFYWRELLGLEVQRSETKKIIGTVKNILETGANDVLVIKKIEGGEMLVPYGESIVTEVNLECGYMLIDWLESEEE